MDFCSVSVICHDHKNGNVKKLTTEECKKIVKVSLLEEPAITVKLCRLTPNEIEKHTKPNTNQAAQPVCSPIQKYSLRGRAKNANHQMFFKVHQKECVKSWLDKFQSQNSYQLQQTL